MKGGGHGDSTHLHPPPPQVMGLGPRERLGEEGDPDLGTKVLGLGVRVGDEGVGDKRDPGLGTKRMGVKFLVWEQELGTKGSQVWGQEGMGTNKGGWGRRS